jgi:hypothetical protein
MRNIAPHPERDETRERQRRPGTTIQHPCHVRTSTHASGSTRPAGRNGRVGSRRFTCECAKNEALDSPHPHSGFATAGPNTGLTLGRRTRLAFHQKAIGTCAGAGKARALTGSAPLWTGKELTLTTAVSPTTNKRLESEGPLSAHRSASAGARDTKTGPRGHGPRPTGITTRRITYPST